MRKSFRVATVFTGAAACAAAFAPAAGAAPVAAGIIPKPITANDCTAGELDWAHMYYTAAENHTIPACFAGIGTYWIAGSKRFTYFCPGNNSGYLWTNYGSIPFSAGPFSYHLNSAIVY
jgi:hypothetical protein